MAVGLTTKRDLTNKEFATLAELQAHIQANGTYYDWGSNFSVYNDGVNNGEYKLTYNQSSTSKLDSANLIKYTPGGDPTVWGTITGTLNDQLDLKAALDSKWPNAGNYNLAAVTRIFTDGFSLRTGTSEVHSFVNGNMTQMKTSSVGNTTIRYLIEMNRLNGVGIKIADNLDGIGLRYEADYSAGLNDLTVPNWGHVKRTIGGVDIAATSQVPGSGQNGYVFAYNFTNGEFELVPNSGIANTAASNELMKSDGANAVPSGLFSSTSGDIVLGNATAPVTETIRNISVAGSAVDIGLALASKGSGEITGDSFRIKLRSSQNNGDVNHGLLIASDVALYKALAANGFGVLMSTGFIDIGYRLNSGTAVTNGLTVSTTDTILTKGSGNILLKGLPVADPLVAEALWNDAGILKVSAG